MIKTKSILKSIIVLFVFVAVGLFCEADERKQSSAGNIALTPPKIKGDKSLEECLKTRRSVRQFADKSITFEQMSQLVWAAQGITSTPYGRTAPSAGALYPLEIYIVATNVENLESGIYRYIPQDHALTLVKDGKFNATLSEAALGQKCVLDAPMSFVIAAEYERTSKKYGERAERYVHMEVGYVSQNIYLETVALDLGTVAVGAFRDDEVAKIIAEPYEPLLIMPVGYPKKAQ